MAGIGRMAAVLAAGSIAASVRAADVAMIELSGSLLEQPSPFAWLFGSSDPTLLDMVDLLDEVAEDSGIEGVVLRVKDAQIGLTQIEELGEAIARVRESGKTVHLFAENYSGMELLLGTQVDETIIQAGGGVFYQGMLVEEMFLADTLEWAGIKADMVQIGAYKGANEQMTRNAPSPAWQQSLDTLLDGLWANITGHFSQGYGLDADELDHALRTVWFADTEEARESGMIGAVVDLASLDEHLEQYYGEPIEWNMDFEPDTGPELDMSNPFAILQLLTSEPDHTADRETIAVLHIEGVIVDGDSTPETAFSGAKTGSRTIRNAVEDILDQDLIKGVVVRIDSPGGSAIASEVIWQGLRRLAEHKPVWVSVGSMAASGGYYCAVGGDTIYVNPSSIVGSIGVVGGKMSMGGLYDKLKINVHTRTRGPMAGMFSSATPWDDAQRAIIRDKMKQTYDLFTGRVSQGRPDIDLSKTAEGRLFTGSMAIDLAMADRVGGLDDALNTMADELDLRDYDVMDFPGPKGLEEMFEDMLGGFASAPVPDGLATLAETGRALLGDERWPAVREGIGGLMLLRDEPVTLTMPRVLIFH